MESAPFFFLPKRQWRNCDEACGSSVGTQLLNLYSQQKWVTHRTAESLPKSLYILFGQHETAANIKGGELFVVRVQLGKKPSKDSKLYLEWGEPWESQCRMVPWAASPCCPGKHCTNCTAQERSQFSCSENPFHTNVICGNREQCLCRLPWSLPCVSLPRKETDYVRVGECVNSARTRLALVTKSRLLFFPRREICYRSY